MKMARSTICTRTITESTHAHRQFKSRTRAGELTLRARPHRQPSGSRCVPGCGGLTPWKTSPQWPDATRDQLLQTVRTSITSRKTRLPVTTFGPTSGANAALIPPATAPHVTVLRKGILGLPPLSGASVSTVRSPCTGRSAGCTGACGTGADIKREFRQSQQVTAESEAGRDRSSRATRQRVRKS